MATSQEPAVVLAPLVAELAFANVDKLTKRNLRLVSHSFREAMATCVTTVYLSAEAPALQHDAGTLFPAVTMLDIDVDSLDLDPDDLSPPRSAKDELAMLLDIIGQLMSTHPELLAKVKRVHLSKPAWCAAAVHNLAPRCASLETLHVCVPGVIATFKGSGATPAEQRAHLQQMLTALSATPELFSPPSLLACHCLHSLKLGMLDLDDAAQLAERFLVHQDVKAPTANKDLSSEPEAPNKPCSSNIQFFDSLVHLSGLTHLEVAENWCGLLSDMPNFFGLVESAGKQAAYEAVLKAVAHLPQLLHLRFSAPLQRSGTWPLASSWTAACANLTQLTSLALVNLNIDLGSLVSLQKLQDLRLNSFCGDVASLFHLTALTCLSLEEAHGFFPLLPDAQGAVEGYLTTALPSAWCTGLKCLVWKLDSQLDPAALGMLGALTYLEVGSQMITFEFAWALAKLPLLEDLSIRSSCAHKSLQHHAPPPLSERPELKSLRNLQDKSGKRTMSLLNILANWTRLPSSGKHLLRVSLAGMEDHHPAAQVQHWSPCWLQALLRCTHKQRFLFLTNADVQSFCAAAEAVGPHLTVCPHLHVGSQLPPAAFQQLVATVDRLSQRCWWLGGWGERLAKVEHTLFFFGFGDGQGEVPDLSYVGVGQQPERALVLTQQHMQGLPAGSLSKLCIADLDGADPDLATVVALVDDAPNLVHLTLVNLTHRFDANDVQSILDAAENVRFNLTLGWEDTPEGALASDAVQAELGRRRAARGLPAHPTAEEMATMMGE